MRIDLHIHTQKCKSGDSEKRNISPEEFVKKMSENNVRVCAITNHNKFDITEFDKIVSLDKELVIFPGIELDVLINEKKSHIILICNPNKRKEFYEEFDGDNNRNYNSYYLLYRDFIEKVRKFNPEDIIIIPHFADKDKSIGKDFNSSPKKELNDYVVILETAKLHTMGMVNSHGHLSLIGSDVQNWDEYNQYDLPEIKFKIDSFRKFYELTSDSNVFIKNVLGEAQKFEISINQKCIPIYNDINVIFGEKGSGKTILLKEYIQPQIVSMGNQVFLHEGKDYQQAYEGIINKLSDQIKIDELKINRISSLFNSIVQYKEPIPVNFVKEYFKYRAGKEKSKNRQKLKKADSVYIKTNNDNIDSIIEKHELDKSSIDKVLEINKQNKEGKRDKEILRKELNNLYQDLFDVLFDKCKKHFIVENIETFLKNLKQSARKNSGSESKISSIGFAKLVSQRLLRIQNNDELLKLLNELKNKYTQKLGVLPNKGEAKFNTNIIVLSRRDKHEKDSVFDRNKIVTNRRLIEKLEDFNIECFSKINDYFTVEESEVEGGVFSKDVIKKSSYISINKNKNYDPSEGEKAILSISGILEDRNYDCYIFDEIERGLGNKYVTEYVIPKLKKLRDSGKTVIISTHNANLAINTLPSQCIYCDYRTKDEEIYYIGEMYSNKLTGIETGSVEDWENNALIHLEGSEEMFNRRRNIYGLY